MIMKKMLLLLIIMMIMIIEWRMQKRNTLQKILSGFQVLQIFAFFSNFVAATEAKMQSLFLSSP